MVSSDGFHDGDVQKRPLWRAEPITEQALAAIIQNLRDDDWREVAAMMGKDFPERLVARFLTPGADGFVVRTFGGAKDASDLGTATAVFWWVETHPGRYVVAMLATDVWAQIGRSLTKFLRRVVIPQLVEEGLEQATCLSIADYSLSHRWLRSLGFRACGTVPSMGIQGQDFTLFAYVAAN